MVRDLTQDLQNVYACRNLSEKKAAANDLVNRSLATNETKRKALLSIIGCMTNYKLDKFMTNYVLSGEGMKVI